MAKIRFNQSLRTRVMIFTGAIFLVLAVFIIAGIMLFIFSTEQTTWRARQSEAAENAAAKVADYLRQNETLLNWLDKFEYDEIQRNPSVLREILKDNPVFLEIIFIDETGNPVIGAAQNQPILANQFTILQSEWFQNAISGKKTYTRVQTSPHNESYTIFAMPSIHGGVLAAQIQMDSLWDKVAQIRFGDAGSIYIVNRKGQVIAHPDRQVVLSNQSIQETSLFKAILQAPGQKWVGDSVNFMGASVVSVSMPIEQSNWIVITEVAQAEAYNTTRRALLIMPVVIFLMMMIAIQILRVLLNRLFMQPLSLLRAGANQIAQGDLSHRIPISKLDEFGEAMSVFNTMATVLEEQNGILRKYAEGLEHLIQERTADLTLANTNLVSEINDRKTAEEQVRVSLQEKDMLLKEIHHRVKNNLQIISSLLSLQGNQVKDTATLQALRDSQARIRSMALIHEKLYQSKSLAKIDIGEYVQSLTTSLFRSYQGGLGEIQLNIQVDEIALDLDYAIPCGLILNELMTNALKYAFPNGRNGTLAVKLCSNPDQTLILQVADDGVGLPPGMDIAAAKTLGLQLVNSLVAQIEGKLEIENSNGANFRVSFKY